jgi:hypothetical protein
MNREISDRGRRLLGIATVVAAALLIAGFLYLVRPRGSQTVVVPLSSVPTGSVLYYASKGFYLVRDDDEVIALRDAEPNASCRVTWRPDLSAAGAAGAFESPCTGRRYDRQGRPVSGGEALMMLPVTTQGEEVRIDISAATGG